MNANYVQRLRLTFSKNGPARFIGHLDLSRTMERSFNRARIPIAYSQGFNRRPRMAFASALPLGFTSEYELADIWLAEEMEPTAAQSEMMGKMAPGIVIGDAANVPLSEPSLQSSMISAKYVVSLPPEANTQEELGASIAGILNAENWPMQRKRGKGKTKEIDLRPLIIDLRLKDRGNEPAQIVMELSHTPSKTGRPDDVLAALTLDPYQALIHRTRIVLSGAAKETQNP